MSPGALARQGEERHGQGSHQAFDQVDLSLSINQRDLDHDLVAHGDGPSPNTRLNISKISEGMTPSGMPNLTN